MRNISGEKDIWAGAIFGVIGCIAVVNAQQDPLGTAMRMGPAFFPTSVGALLALLGLVTICKGVFRGSGPIGSWPVRPLVFLPLAVLGFALLVRPVGLVGASLVLVMFSALSGWEFRLREVLPLAAGLTALAVVVFVGMLGLPFKIWPI